MVLALPEHSLPLKLLVQNAYTDRMIHKYLMFDAIDLCTCINLVLFPVVLSAGQPLQALKRPFAVPSLSGRPQKQTNVSSLAWDEQHCVCVNISLSE